MMLVFSSPFFMMRRDRECYPVHVLYLMDLEQGISRFDIYLLSDGGLEYNVEWVSRLFEGTLSPALHLFGLGYFPNSDIVRKQEGLRLLPYGELLYTMEYLYPSEFSHYILDGMNYYMRSLSYELRFFLVHRVKSYVERWYDYFETLLLTYGCISYRAGV
jgi:hypothetical protein